MCACVCIFVFLLVTLFCVISNAVHFVWGFVVFKCIAFLKGGDKEALDWNLVYGMWPSYLNTLELGVLMPTLPIFYPIK